MRDNFYIIPREIRSVKMFFQLFPEHIRLFRGDSHILPPAPRSVNGVFLFLLKQIVEADAKHNYSSYSPDRFFVFFHPPILPKNTFQIQQGDDKCNDGENLIGFHGRTLLFSTGLESRGGFFLL